MAATDSLGGQFKFPMRVFHGTTSKNAQKIVDSGEFSGFATPDVTFADEYSGGGAFGRGGGSGGPLVELNLHPKNPFIAEEYEDDDYDPKVHDANIVLNDGKIIMADIGKGAATPVRRTSRREVEREQWAG